MFITQSIKISFETTFVCPFDIVNCLAVLNELIKGALFFWDDLIWQDILFTKYGIDILQQFERDDFMGKLVIILIQKLCEAKIKDQWMSILCFDKIAVLDDNLTDFLGLA